MTGPRGARTAVLVTVAALLGALLACTHGSQSPHSEPPTIGATSGAASATSPWTGWPRCAAKDLAEFRCGAVKVPLDRSDPAGRGLALAVLLAGRPDATRTVLFLSGGPGQPGLPFAPGVVRRLGAVAREQRVVLVDQRGTGANALLCPLLQRQVGYSDLEVPTPAAVDECAESIGDDRDSYGTTDTVADLDDVRRALGVERWSIDGVSYGTYVAQRYAAAHPDAVDRLVLDSVVPVEAFSATNVESFPDMAAVLRRVCELQHCSGDPAHDLSTTVARYRLGPALLDVISVMSVADPTFPGLLDALRRGAAGDPGPVRALIHTWQTNDGGPARALSQGLHASTLCLDLTFPWGGADAAPVGRATAADRAVARLSPSELFPFDARTARANGEMVTCERWPAEPDPAVDRLVMRGSGGRRIPALLLHGELDLSTPMVWTRRAQHDLPGAELVVVPGAGHSVQSRGPAAVQRRVVEFLGAG